jgi:hypothetical protein
LRSYDAPFKIAARVDLKATGTMLYGETEERPITAQEMKETLVDMAQTVDSQALLTMGLPAGNAIYVGSETSSKVVPGSESII